MPHARRAPPPGRAGGFAKKSSSVAAAQAEEFSLVAAAKWHREVVRREPVSAAERGAGGRKTDLINWF